jgi:hypothetical protein
MYEHTSELPEGPTAGDSVFQPPDKHKRLRTKAELVAEKQKNTKKKVTKRKSPPNSPQQQQEGNKRSKTTTQTAAATAQANTTPEPEPTPPESKCWGQPAESKESWGLVDAIFNIK